MAKQFQCELISWEEVYRLSVILARHIQDAAYRPDIIIAIARGGYVPARILCDLLDIYNLTSFRVSHYTAGSSKEETARLSSPLCMELKGLKVLVVDDITDTGDSLEVALDHISQFGPAEVKVAALQHKEQSRLMPDYYAKQIREWCWIIYPWAVTEDIGGFLRAMPELPRTVEEANAILQDDYGVTVPAQILSQIFQMIEENSQQGV